MFSLPPAPPAYVAPPWLGPLPVKGQGAFSGLIFTFEPAAASVLARGERRLSVRADIGNNLEYIGPVTDHAIFQDDEVASVRAGVAAGIGNGGELSAQFTATTRGGGVLDPFIRFWHRAIVPFEAEGIGTPPDGRTLINVVSYGRTLEITDPKSAITSVALEYKREVGPGVAVRASAKLPLSGGGRIFDGRGDYLDNGAVDLGVGALLSRTVKGRLVGHANLNLVRNGATHVGELVNGRRYEYGSLVALEYRLDNRTSLVVQGEDIGFPYLRDEPGANRRQSMSFGAQRQSGGTAFYASFSENIYPFRFTGYAPDFQLSCGVSVRL